MVWSSSDLTFSYISNTLWERGGTGYATLIWLNLNKNTFETYLYICYDIYLCPRKTPEN